MVTKRCRLSWPLVKYGSVSPKFIWVPYHVMCTDVLIDWDPQPHPPAFGLVSRALVVSKDRRHLFVTPWSEHSYAQWAQINFGDLTPYFTFDILGTTQTWRPSWERRPDTGRTQQRSGLKGTVSREGVEFFAILGQSLAGIRAGAVFKFLWSYSNCI